MLLPKLADVNKAKALERKIEIDNVVALARQIDSLRATFAQERLAHDNWKNSSIEALNNQLQGLQDGIDAKKREISVLDEQRQKLIEPLDLEWTSLHSSQERLKEEKQELYLDQERFKDKVKDLEEEKLKVGHSLKKAKQNEQRTEKSLEEAEEIKEFTQKSSQDALVQKEQQENYFTSRNKDLEKSIQEYEVALKTIEIREQQVKDKESELLEREILLKDRQAMFERDKLR